MDMGTLGDLPEMPLSVQLLGMGGDGRVGVGGVSVGVPCMT